MSDTTADTARPPHFIRQIIERDLSEGKNGGAIVTRFPPEPNGYLHIGHAKSICLNFGIAADYGGQCNLRFDDTNPTKEDDLFVKAIKEDVRWLGFDWGERLFHASDYFEQLYEWAVELIQNGKAYVCELTADEIRSSRGTLTTPGVDSPYRNRSAEENLALFSRMRDGEFPEGSCVLRAKIDMASPNMNMRDPTLYRIRHQTHQNTGDRWRIYPMYDYTHPLSDAIEGVTHSLCTLEFEDHRPLYDWVLDNVSAPCHPQQIEFSRLELDYTVMSKRLLTTLVSEGLVNGWDDPRMPTISGMRRRGYTPGAIRDFSDRVGVTKKNQRIEMKLLESCVREDLEATAPPRDGRGRSGQAGHRKLRGGGRRVFRRTESSGGCVNGYPIGTFLSGTLRRALRHHGGPAQEVLPPCAGTGSAFALRVLRYLPGSDQGCRRRDRGGALHIRP